MHRSQELRRGRNHGRQVGAVHRRGGKYRFRLKASNGQVIASSEAYESKASAETGIASVQANADSETVELT